MIEINKNYNESNLATMARMPDNLIDLTVTSPPYDNLREYNGYSFDFEAVAKELFRVTKQGGVVVWIVGDATIKGSETGTSFRQALYFKEIGFNLHDTMIYHKNCLPKNHNRYEQEFEYMFVFSKGRPSIFNPIRSPCSYAGTSPKSTFRHNGKEAGRAHKIQAVKIDKIKGNIWKIDGGFMRSTKDAFAFEHSAIFPEKLANDHIISWSNENDLIYDPFMGSGTTAKMSILNNRNWIGSEISSKYCNIIEERIKKAWEEKRKEKDYE
jgi:DNA modification methylase